MDNNALWSIAHALHNIATCMGWIAWLAGMAGILVLLLVFFGGSYTPKHT